MAIFTAIATWALAGTFLAGSTFAIGALAIGLGVATQIGLSYALKPKQSQPAAASDHFGVQGTLQAAGDVPRSFPLGQCVTAGSLTWFNQWGTIQPGGQPSTPNAYLTQVIALADLPGSTLAGVIVNGELVTLGFNDTDPPYGQRVVEYVKDGQPYLWVKYYDGTQTTADPLCMNFAASAERPYPSTRVGTGVAYVVVTALVNGTLFTGVPALKFVLSGIPLYDPSKDDTVGGSGSQRFSDPSTWGGDGDDLTAVQKYNILRGIYYEDTWVYGLQNMTGARLPAANWIAQIAKCREPIAGEDGDEPTYRTGMQVNVNAQPANVLTALMTGCQGKISEVGGFYKTFLGAPDSPTFAFTDDDIISTEPQTFRPFFALADSVNGIQGRYPDPSQGWNYATAPAYYRTDLEVKDGNRRLMASPTFDAVPYPSQVQRLQKSAIEEGQRARTHTIVLPPEYWIVEPGDVGEWTSVRNGYDAKQFRVDGGVDKANLDVGLSITEVDPTDFDWDHGTDFKPVVSGPTNIVRPAAQGVVDWFAEPTILYDADGIGRRPAIRLAWDGTVPGVVGVTYQVRLESDHSAVTAGRTDQLAEGAIIVAQSLIPNTDYQVRGQYLPSAPRDMLWSDWLDVTTPDIRMSLAEFDAAVRYQVTTLIDDLSDKIDAAVQRIAAATANQDARNWLDKKQIRSQLFATAGGATAAIEEVRTVAVNASEAVAMLETAVTAEFNGINATVTEQATAISQLGDYAAASWSVMIDVNGNVIGLVLVNDTDEISAFTVTVDKFLVAFPGHAGGAAVPVFSISNVNGVAKIALRGDMLVDGAILARMISAGEIQAVHLSANSILAASIAAGQIDSTKIAVNGVDIINLIAGAATQITAVPFAATGIGSPATFGSQTVTIKGGTALCFVSCSLVGAADTLSLIVDGTTQFQFAISANFSGSWFYPVSGLSVGTHTIVWSHTNSHGAGASAVVDLRR
jgi:hypothetical protein